MKLSDMNQTKSEAKAERKAMDAKYGSPGKDPEPKEGIEVTLEHHHIKNLGLDKALPHGTTFRVEGEGHVMESRSEDSDGEPRHHMKVMITKAGMKHDAEDSDGDGLRDELKKNLDKDVEKQAGAGKGGNAKAKGEAAGAGDA